MAAQQGRGFLIQMDISGTDTTIGGATSGEISFNNEVIDITNKDSSGFRELLANGKKSADISLSGINLDDSTIGTVRNSAMNGTTESFTIVIPGAAGGSAGSWSFSGIIDNLAESGEEAGALTYSVSIKSSGTITWTDLV